MTEKDGNSRNTGVLLRDAPQNAIFPALTLLRRLLRRALTLTLAAALLAPLRPAQAAVTLSYFRPLAGDGLVRVEWRTASELDTLAFQVQRSLEQGAGFTDVSESISAHGDPLIGGDYVITDTTVANGVTYWYRLKETSTNFLVTYHDPVSVTPGATPTPTATAPAATPTRTRTATGTLPTVVQITLTPTQTSAVAASPTPTRTLTPYLSPTTAGYLGPTSPAPVATVAAPQVKTATPVGGQPGAPTPPGLTPTEVPGAAPVFTDTITQSATLIPLPSLTLIFPTPSPAALAQAPTEAPVRPAAPAQTPQRLLPVALIGLIWLILVTWWIYTLRKHD